MNTEETIKYIKDGLAPYYQDRREKGYVVPDETLEKFYRILPEIEGLAELFTAARNLQELSYSNEPDCPNRAKAFEYGEERRAARAKYPLADKVYGAFISRHTVWIKDEVSPHIEEIIEEYKARKIS